VDGGDSYSTYEIGTDLSLAPYKDTGLVGYWKFDDYTSGNIAFNQTNGLADSSGYGYTTIAENANGTGMSFVEGKRGGAVSFDGTDDYLRTNYDSHFDIGTGDFSISYWVYPRSMKHVYNLIGKAEYAPSKGYMLRLNLNGSIENYIGDGSGSYWFSLGQASAYSVNNWYHIILSLDRDGAQNFYINGVLKRTQSITNSVDITESDSLAFGYFLYGYMDEIRMYNRALSASEVKSLYEGTK
jgi:sialidase-1